MDPEDKIEESISSVHVPKNKSKTKTSESSLDEVKSLIDEIDVEPNCKEILSNYY